MMGQTHEERAWRRVRDSFRERVDKGGGGKDYLMTGSGQKSFAGVTRWRGEGKESRFLITVKGGKKGQTYYRGTAKVRADAWG